MTISTEIHQKALSLLEKLPQQSLSKAVEYLETLSQNIEQETISQGTVSNENQLIKIIQFRLSPEKQKHLNYLRQQNETGKITEQEHQELLNYVDQIEQQDAQRAEALIQLAQLRQVDLKIIIDEFFPNKLSI
jgi:mRNA-degrading endonuclease RelE of RelBE toxin-antitoxin system